MKRIFTVLACLILAMTMLALTSCGDEQDDEDYEQSSSEQEKNQNNYTLTYSENADGTYTVTGYEGNLTYLNVPKLYQAKAVTAIAESAFEECDTLENVRLSENLVSVGSRAFYGCDKLKTVTLVASLEKLSKNTFSACPLLTKITVDEQNTKYTEIDGNLYSDNGKTLCLYVPNKTEEEFIIPAHVTSIEGYAFGAANNLKRVTIPEGVTKINKNAFVDCAYLEQVNLKATSLVDMGGVMAVAGFAFNNCGNSGVGITVNIAKNVTAIPSDLFYSFYSVNITKVIFEQGSVCESLGKYAFAYSKLTEISLPDSIKTIDQSAFSGCTQLKSISLPTGLTSLGAYAFSNCDSLQSIKIPDGVSEIKDYAFDECDTLSTVLLPSSLTKISEYAFENSVAIQYNEYENAYYLGSEENPHLVLIKAKDKSIESCQINENTRIIYMDAFDSCTALTEIAIPEGVVSIGKKAFNCCSALKKIAIPSSVTEIEYMAFCDCTALTSISYNAQLEALYMGNDVFLRAGQKDNGIVLVIGKSVRKLPSYLFYAERMSDCAKVINVMFEQDCICEEIADNVFNGCQFLRSISIPDTVTKIGVSAFTDCKSLDKVYVSSVEAWLKITLDEYTSNPLSNGARLYVDLEPVVMLEIPSGTETIKQYAFYGCSGILGVTLPSTLKTIEQLAFSGCTGLMEIYNFSDLDIQPGSIENGEVARSAKVVNTSETDNSLYTELDNYLFMQDSGSYYLVAYIGSDTELVLPDSFEGSRYSIYNSAFAGNITITSVTIPDSVTYILEKAFLGCTSLSNVKIGIGVVTIENYAFSGCTSLKSITIPSGVKYILKNAFTDCTALEDVTFEVSGSWYVTSGRIVNSGGTRVSVASSSANASNLTNKYTSYHWYRE